MKKLFIILSVFLFSISFPMKAQFDTQLSNYWAVTNYYNPGYAGQSEKLEFAGLYRLQWLGIENAPKSGIIAGNMPVNVFGKQHGAGISLYNDQLGLFKTSVMSGQFAYKLKFLGNNLGIGLQVGYINESFDGSKVKLPGDDDSENVESGSSSNDEAIPSSTVSGSSIDAAFGLFYSKKDKGYVGISVTHLTAPKLELTDNIFLEIPRTYYFTAGYNIKLNNPLIELRPSVLMKTVELSSFYVESDSLVAVNKGNTLKGMWKQTQIDVSMRMVYNKSLWGGVSWRKDDAIVVMLGTQFKMFEIGYAYDFPISKIRTVSTGSHELFLRYSMDLDMKKGKKGNYKSVRIL